MQQKLTTLICILIFSIVKAQTTEPTKEIVPDTVPFKVQRSIKISPLSLIASRLVISYEQSIKNSLSLQSTIGLMGGGIANKVDTIQTQCTGIFLNTELRFYVRKKAITGLYLSPMLKFMSFIEKNNDLVFKANKSVLDYTRKTTSNLAGLSIMLGYQGIKKRFVYDFGIGAISSIGSVKTTYNSNKVDLAKFNKDRMEISPIQNVGTNLQFTFTIGYLLK